MLKITIWSSRVFESIDKFSDYSGHICTKNSQLIVKNRLISYIQKIRFSSLIKKTRVLIQKCMGEKICEMTFNMYCHVFLTIFPNFLFKWKKKFVHCGIPSFAYFSYDVIMKNLFFITSDNSFKKRIEFIAFSTQITSVDAMF